MHPRYALFFFLGVSVVGCAGDPDGADDDHGSAGGGKADCVEAAVDDDGVCRLANGSFAPATCCETSADEPAQVTCTLARRSDIPGASETLSVTFSADGDYGHNSGIRAYEATFGFSAELYGDEISVVVDETDHISDEILSFDCDAPADADHFCERPVEIDRNIGLELDDVEKVHAFDFGCSRGEGEDGPTVTCGLTRREDIPSPAWDVVTFPLADDEIGDSDQGITAFAGHYGFTTHLWEGELSVTFYENNFVTDEVGSFYCSLDASGATFCREPIEVDRNLGREGEYEAVHALDFSCQVAAQ